MTESLNDQIVRIEAEIAKLKQAIALLAALPTAQHSLQEQLVTAERTLAGLQSQSGGANLGQGNQIGQTGDIIGGNKIIYTTPPGDDPTSLVRRYLAGVIRETRRLTYVDADSADAEQAPLALDQIYIRLEVAAQVGADGKPLGQAQRRERAKPEPVRQMTALEALGYHGRLVLLGSPGSGKSTFARHLAYCLARAGCGEARLELLAPDWRRGALTPIWVELSPFADWLSQSDTGQSPGELLWAYLAAQHSPALAAELRRRLESDTAVLLLDGLDEVPAGQLLARVRAAIEALTATRSPSTALLTCRVLDYAEPRRALRGWPTETLLPFSNQLQHAFIAGWFGTLEREGRTLQGSAAELTERLQRAVREKADLQRLAGNPLLLTMMATLQGARGELPDKRVELYEQCLDQLLRRWRRRPGRPDLEGFLGIEDWSRADTDRLLDHLGYAAESKKSDDAADDDDTGQTGSAHLTRRGLIDAAEGVFAKHVSNPLSYAERLCEYIDTYGSNGIVQKHGPDHYRFPHRTFREFLAARRLISNHAWPDEPKLTQRLVARATNPQWHEALLLAASLLVVKSTADSLAMVVRKLLEVRAGSRAWAANIIAAGELLAQTERRELEGFGEARVWDDTIAALIRLLDQAKQPRPRYDTATLVRAGLALGQLGDLRAGICTLNPDWCDVPKGEFLLGSTGADADADDDEKPQRNVWLPDFRISRYPVTNAQWRAFLDAGGYRERQWWSDAGWQAKEQGGWSEPALWDNPRFNGANQPVVGVSWYEATAFCRWLSAELGYAVRLPSEAEWEKAARGIDGRIYPWGNAWEDNASNAGENSLDRPAPVGCFPRDRSEYGLMDLSGNISEWTATPWRDRYDALNGTTVELWGRLIAQSEAEDAGDVDLADRAETAEEERYTIRGGAWFSSRMNARCAVRDHLHPSARGNVLGLRVVAALTPTE